MRAPAATRWVLPLLVLLLAAATGLRLHELGQGTIGHIESYTPGIVYPEGISDPPSRLDQRHNFVWAINDVHGPFWYLWMLPYTRAAGTSLAAMRLPAAVLGIGAVWLTFLVGRRAVGPWTGVLAAGLMVFAGHHVYWSRQARFYSSACFFAVLSTWLLLRLAEGGGRWSLAAYLATTLAGLSTIYYYWPVALLQLLWMLGVEARRGIRVAGWQLWMLTLAAPIVTLAIYQARPGPYLAYDDWRFLGGYFTFGFLLEPAIDAGSGLHWRSPLVWILPPVALLCGVFGLRALRAALPVEGESPVSEPPVWLMALTAAAASVLILWAGGLGAAAFPHKTMLLRASAVFPLLGVAAFLLLRRVSLPAPVWLRSPLALAALLGLVPAFVMAGISQAFPFYAPRGMLCFTPFLLILFARGIIAMGGAGAAVCLLLVFASAGSVRTALADPGAIDYGGAAREWRPRIQDSDAIFLAPHWSTTPELFYLQGRYDQLVGRNWLQSDADRAWAILIPGAPHPAEFRRALEARERIATIRRAGIEIALFEKK